MLEDNQFYLGFNSTLVQLKVSIHKEIYISIHSFNSTLVQLKVALSIRRVVMPIEFQFYLSSIKRCSESVVFGSVESVSILP